MIVIGAGGLAKQMIGALQYRENEELSFFDDITTIETFLGRYNVIKEREELIARLKAGESYALGFGNPIDRKRIFLEYREYALAEQVISPDAVISEHGVVIESGVVILPQVIIEPDVTIGKGALINIKVALTHDVQVGDFCEIAPGVILLGRVSVGNGVLIGAGAVVMPRITIGDNAVIGAGAVVTKDVPPNVRVAGIPARPL